MDAPFLNPTSIREIYQWVDTIPFTKPKKNIHQDFADAINAASIIHHYAPNLVDLLDYPPSFLLRDKITNWKLLNNKVFK